MISEELKAKRIEGVVSGIPKGGDQRGLVEIWDGKDWGDKGVKVDQDISLLRMGMLRWWKCRITQGFCKFLRRTSSACRGLIKEGGVHVIENWYEQDGETRQ